MILAEQQQNPGGRSGALNDDELGSVVVHREEDYERAIQPSSGNDQLVAPSIVDSYTSDDDGTSTSGSNTSVAEDEDLPMEELDRRGWINNATSGTEVNGVALPPADDIKIGTLHSENSNVHVGQRIFIKSQGNVIIKSVSYVKSPSEEHKVALENGSIHSDKDGNGIFGSSDEKKLSTTSDNPLYPSSRVRVPEWVFSRKSLIICSSVWILLLIVAISLYLIFSGRGTTGTTIPPYLPASPNDTSINNGAGDNQLIVQRSQWGAKSPSKTPERLLVNPPEKVIIYHTVTDFCLTKSECSNIIRNIQYYHMYELGYNDIGYNFLIGGDGRVYVGRGWGVIGAHTIGQNSISISVAFIGDYTVNKPTSQQIKAMQKLFNIGVQEKDLAENYKVLGHRQVWATISPGDNLYNIIITLEHWSEDP